MTRERDPTDERESPAGRVARHRLSLEELQRRLAEAEGDPEAAIELVREMVTGVIEEVRELAEASEDESSPDPADSS